MDVTVLAGFRLVFLGGAESLKDTDKHVQEIPSLTLHGYLLVVF